MQYTAEAVTDGNGRNGTVRTSDGLIDLQLGIPAEIGGAGGNVANPELLFAAGYSACFMSALSTVARQHKVKLVDASVKALVTIASGDDGFGLSVELVVSMPGVEPDAGVTLLEGAHKKCPYSKAINGNIPVSIRQA